MGTAYCGLAAWFLVMSVRHVLSGSLGVVGC